MRHLQQLLQLHGTYTRQQQAHWAQQRQPCRSADLRRGFCHTGRGRHNAWLTRRAHDSPHLCLLACPVKVGGRIMTKRIHVRVEHVQPSRCREEFLNRRAKNDAAKAEAKKKGGE